VRGTRPGNGRRGHLLLEHPTPLSRLRDRITTELSLPDGVLQFAGELLAA